MSASASQIINSLRQFPGALTLHVEIEGRQYEVEAAAVHIVETYSDTTAPEPRPVEAHRKLVLALKEKGALPRGK